MIKLAPIHENIRKELNLRMEALSRKKPVINTAKDASSFTRIDYMAKSPWMRMISLVDTNNIFEKKEDSTVLRYVGGGITGAVINGGFLKRQEIIAASKNPAARKQFKFLSNKQMYGVNLRDDISQESKFSQLHAPIPGITEIVVEYKGGLKALRMATITWQVHTLEDLDLLLPHFLTPGRNVILEWGWRYPTRAHNISSKYDLKDIFNGGKVTIDAIYENVHEFSFNSNGNQESMIGIIKGFNYTMREDGGFDCTTELITVGVNIYSHPLKTSINVGVDVVKNEETGETERISKKPDFTDFLKSFGNNIITQYQRKEPQLKIDTDNNAFIYIKPTRSGRTLTTSGTSDMQLFVSWGWLEDNILSKFIGKFTGNSIIAQIRSYDIIDGNKESVQISNHKYLYSPNLTKFILPGQIPAAKNESPEVKNIIRSIKDFRNFTNPNNVYSGYLRNILLSWDLIIDSFADQVTIDSGMRRLYNKINEDVGIWNFQFVNDAVDPNNFKTVDMNTTDIDLTNTITEELRTVNKKGNIGNPDRSVFIFPAWSSDSIITAQTMNVSLPNSMAIAAMYGNTFGKSQRIGSPDMIAFSGNELSNVDSIQSTYVDNSIAEIQLATDVKSFGNMKADLNKSLIGTSNLSIYTTDIKLSAKDTTFEDVDIKLSFFQKLLLDDKEKKELLDEKIAGSKKKKSIKDTEKLVNAINSLTSGQIKFFYDTRGKLYNKEPLPILETMKLIINLSTRGQNGTSLFLEPFDLEIELDGISGILPGNIFTSSYLPSRYKKQVIFQVFSVTQTINTTTWTTSITGKPRFVFSTRKTLPPEMSPRKLAEVDVINRDIREQDYIDNPADANAEFLGPGF